MAGKETGPKPGTKTARVLEAVRQGKPTAQIAQELNSPIHNVGILVMYALDTYHKLSPQERAIRRAEGISFSRNKTWLMIKPFAKDYSPSAVQQAVLLTTGENIPMNNIHQSLKKARKLPRRQLEPLTPEERTRNLQDGHKLPEELWQEILLQLEISPGLEEDVAKIISSRRLPSPQERSDWIMLIVYLLGWRHVNDGKLTLMDEFSKALSRSFSNGMDDIFPKYMQAIYSEVRSQR